MARALADIAESYQPSDLAFTDQVHPLRSHVQGVNIMILILLILIRGVVLLYCIVLYGIFYFV